MNGERGRDEEEGEPIDGALAFFQAPGHGVNVPVAIVRTL